jgi:hypothetical protein
MLVVTYRSSTKQECGETRFSFSFLCFLTFLALLLLIGDRQAELHYPAGGQCQLPKHHPFVGMKHM